jgi:hypothetical protein
VDYCSLLEITNRPGGAKGARPLFWALDLLAGGEIKVEAQAQKINVRGQNSNVGMGIGHEPGSFTTVIDTHKC